MIFHIARQQLAHLQHQLTNIEELNHIKANSNKRHKLVVDIKGHSLLHHLVHQFHIRNFIMKLMHKI